MRTRRKGRWLLKQPRLGARMCQGTFFFTVNRNIKKFLIFLKKSLHSSILCDNIFFVDSAWFSKATVNKCRNGGIGRRVRFRSV